MSKALVRRELAVRQAAWVPRVASALARAGVQPNTVSKMSVVFSLVALAAFGLTSHAGGYDAAAFFVVAAAAMQLRLLCNLFDGILAVEGGMRTRTGDLFNEIPDRIADVVILVGAGLSARDLVGGVALGWAAAVLALFTAYVRVLGGSLGVTQRFTGPMAKQHRMFVLTAAALVSAAEASFGRRPDVMRAALAVIVAGAAVTASRRIASIARELE
jgi:phosphatidylglycerophosphate synthase